MLRHPEAKFRSRRFLATALLCRSVPGSEMNDAKRILIASGKVGHDLQAECRKRKDTSNAIFFLDSALPAAQEGNRPKPSRPILDAHEIVYVQEEPCQHGLHSYVMPRLQRIAEHQGRRIRAVKRSASASPATGSAKAHEMEQKTLLSLAFTTAATE